MLYLIFDTNLTTEEPMAISARTAPQSKGIFSPDQLESLAVEMDEIAAMTSMNIFLRDAGISPWAEIPYIPNNPKPL